MDSVSDSEPGPMEGMTCFVCDGSIAGRYSNLASCKTQVTKQKVVEKLGQLVGEQYMVVISEDDVICRSCNTMLNNLDRLEKEMSSVRAVILRFLEKKYELEEGELANSKVVLPPPQNLPELTNAFKKTEAPIKFKERKKQSALTNDTEAKSNIWMQCDRCKYTTPYSSFMINHIHRHGEAKPAQQEQVQPQVEEDPSSEPVASKEETVIDETPVSEEVSKQETGTLEAAETTTPTKNVDTEVMTNGVSESGEEMEVANGAVEGETSETAIVEMDENGTMCMVDENGVLQKVQQGEDGQLYLVEDEVDGSKQMLSVGEDGTVQMVQVMWDDMVSNDENMQNMQF